MSEGRIPKPQLRNLHLTRVKRNLGIMVALAGIVGVTTKVLLCDSYDRKVEEFYKTYDPMAALKRMNEAGLMQSYPVE